MKKISILGAGWLGGPLALQLKAKEHQVKVSTTTSEKLSFFKENNVDAFLITINKSSNDDLDQLLIDTDLLIITIPPGRTQTVEENYVDKIKYILPFIKKHNIKEVIFTSSTTVYLSLKGLVDENTPIVPVSEMDKQIVTIEQLLLNDPNFNAAILRLGGLIGEDRHPVQFIVKKEVVEDANNPVNMVHRKDIIRFIDQMVTNDIPNEIFNIVAPVKLNRRDFYTREANKLKLSPLPKFIDNPNADMRKVSGEKITDRYGLDYLYLLD
ncbi:NAD(P)H-binding protein [Flavobacterium dauae]|uniref:NAD(P)H-binding protein n=1 Tax=Flavobacterium dauae TaxID=1563479 RepID=UPI00101B25C3|nr:NAD(P)H-binding protein [Flavobacterium dauae]WLD22648.1 NAD(P)H-binding protein [Flavobacterium dauae]